VAVTVGVRVGVLVGPPGVLVTVGVLVRVGVLVLVKVLVGVDVAGDMTCVGVDSQPPCVMTIRAAVKRPPNPNMTIFFIFTP